MEQKNCLKQCNSLCSVTAAFPLSVKTTLPQWRKLPQAYYTPHYIHDNNSWQKPSQLHTHLLNIPSNHWSQVLTHECKQLLVVAKHLLLLHSVVVQLLVDGVVCYTTELGNGQIFLDGIICTSTIQTSGRSRISLRVTPSREGGASTYSLLDKVMLRNQWHIGVQEHHLVFKGLMQLNYNALIFTHFVSLHDDAYLFPYLVMIWQHFCRKLQENERIWTNKGLCLQHFSPHHLDLPLQTSALFTHSLNQKSENYNNSMQLTCTR